MILHILYSCTCVFYGNMQMENQNRDLADENSCLREEVERLQTVLNQYLSESALGKVSVTGT